MKLRCGLTSVIASVCLVGLVAGCGSVSVPAEEGPAPAPPLPVGWSELPNAPYPEELEGPVTFWAGTELVVAGGYDFDYEVLEVTHYTATYAYSPATGQWTESAPLVVPGYDGLQSFTGMWTGSAWLGIAQPCRDGQVQEEYASVACADIWLGVRWTVDGGWVISADPIPPAAVSADGPGVRIAGMSSEAMIVTTVTGYLTNTMGENADWTFTPWPLGVNPMDALSTCVVADQILTISSVPGPETLPPGDSLSNHPHSVTVNTLSFDGEVLHRQPFGDTHAVSLGPYCQPDQAMFVQIHPLTGTESTIFRLTANEVVPLPTDTSGSLGNPPLVSVNSEWTDVGTGVVSFSTRSYFLDNVTGIPTELQPVAPSIETTVWTGEVLYLNPRASLVAIVNDTRTTRSTNTNRWFAFLPRGSWPESADLGFPFTLEVD